MSVTNIAQHLKERGLVGQAGGGDMEQFLAEPRTVYLGIDPTADSLHVGNLVPVLLMKHLADAGHRVVFLIGGGTGMIGDPRESGERVLLDAETVAANTKALQTQLGTILGTEQYTLYNNAEWLEQLTLVEFLRDTAKHFTVNQLVKRDIIKKRLDAEDPLSFTEFSYSLLQAYDYWYLYRRNGVDLQVGGSDQWANIISGVDLVRRREGAAAYALTTPIIIDKKSGKKFGKSEGNAVWLDPHKTPPFAFYQFWFNVPDDGVEEYLNIFTLLSREVIREVCAAHTADPQQRIGQRRLAFEVTNMIHGAEAAEAAERISQNVFGEQFSLASLSTTEIDLLIAGMPGAAVTDTQIDAGLGITEALVHAGIATSKSDARRLVEGGAVHLNGMPVDTPDHVVGADAFTHGALLLRAGKKVALLSRHL